MQGGNYGTNAELEIEPPGNVADDPQQGYGHRHQGVFTQFVANGRTDLGGAVNRDRNAGYPFGDRLRYGLGCLANRDLCLKGHLDQQLVAVLDLLQFRLNPSDAQSLARIGQSHWFVKLQLQGCATGKIDPHIGRTTRNRDHTNDADQRNDSRDDKGDLPFADKIDIGLS